MKVINVLFGQTIRLLKISGPGGGTIYGRNLARECENRYGFLQGPRELKDFNASEGITFLHGYFQNRVVIDRFQVFTGGVLVEAKADTDALDAFLDDVTQWVQQPGVAQVEQNPMDPRFYTSHLEVQSTVLLNQAFNEFHSFGRDMADLLRGYNQVTPDFSLIGLMIGPGPGGSSLFRYEARVERPPGFYFTTAPLRTADHVRMLDSLEAILSSRASAS
jgi:hypothetical protein